MGGEVEYDFVIWRRRNGYFREMTNIGPMFGGKLDEAVRFTDRVEACKVCALHWAFCDAAIKKVKRR